MPEEFLTSQGLRKLKEELECLVKIKRSEVATRLKEAVMLGDLSENAEYIEAKDEQAFVEGRVSEIEEILRNAKIITGVPKAPTKVQIGCAMELESGSGIKRFTLVGKTEANPDNGEISADSPVGRAVLGRNSGEVVDVSTPVGKKKYRIVRIV